MNVRIAVAVLLIVLPVAFNVIFLLLQKLFAYPDVLRKPTGDILERFTAGGSRLVGLWYAFTLTALLFIPLGVLLPRLLAPDNPAWFSLAAALGVLAGLVQVLGLLRWPFLVPYLAKTYTQPDASPASRQAVEVVFQAFHQYLGVAVGEHLGYLFTSAWTALIAYRVILYSTAPWFGWLGLLCAAGILVGMLEPAGFKRAGSINAIAYILWSLWLVALGVIILI
jgi:Domain of unknown function (DUF4386)